ncbi:MAG: hypothetical protein KBF73_09560 [Flavobacteriales bacterium]|jgi:hypothetical protein|nr:hypothetical protein [Flavobacteriales bacterium]
MSKPRIPEAILAFNDYINTTDDYQSAINPLTVPLGTSNAIRLGLNTNESDAWTAKRTYWRDKLFPKYSNPITSSSSVKAEVRNFMKNFRAFANPLLNKMVASGAATSDDGNVFNFVAVRDTTLTARGKMDDIPFVKLAPNGGGEVKIKVRTSTDSNRASRHPLSDGVEIRWAIIIPHFGAAEALALPETSGDCPHSFISSRAIFTLATGEESKNRNLYCFFRWINLANPSHNGPWSDRSQSGIL